MNLSKRLKSVFDFVEDEKKVLDIGTDHGYLPINIAKYKNPQKIIAADINLCPLNMAKKSIKEENLEDKIETRLGSGLSVIKPFEVDTVTICGMGGSLMVDILKEDLKITKSLENLILQPQEDSYYLRVALYELGFSIVDEDIVLEDGRLYEIIFAKNKPSDKPRDIYLHFGYENLRKNHPLFKELLKKKMKKWDNILKGMDKSTSAKDSEKYRYYKNLKKEGEKLYGADA